MKHLVTTRWKNNLTFESDNPSGNFVIMDAAIEGKTTRKGLSPKAMMLSSLAGCSALDVVSILNKMKVEIDDFKIEVFGSLTDQQPKYYHKVAVNYHFYGANLNKAKCERAVKLSAEKYCGVMEMFRQFAKVEIKTQYHIA